MIRTGSATLALVLLAACAGDTAPVPPSDPAPPALAPVTAQALEALAAAPGLPIAPEGLDNIAAGDPPPTDDEAREAVRGLTGFAANASAADQELAMADLVALGDRLVVAAYEVALDRSLSPGQRLAAVDALAALASEPALEVLFRVQRDATDAPYLRARSAWRIGELGLEETVPQLTLRLKYEIDPEAILWLTWALARLGSLAGYAGVVEMLESWDLTEAQRATIAAHAAELEEPYGVGTPHELLALWNAPPSEVHWAERGQAYDRAVLLWIERLEEYDLRVIDEARFLLPRLDQRGADLLAETLRDEGLYRRIHAAQCLGRMDGRALHRLDDVLAACHRPDTAERALEALAGIGGERARQAIEDRLAPHRPAELRITAAYALGDLGDREAIPALEGAWPTPGERGARELEQALAVALAELGQEAAMLPRLARDLTDPALSPVPSRDGVVAWLESIAETDPWAAAQLREMPPIGQDTTPLDVFWRTLATAPEFAERVARLGEAP
ncbi:MAG: HEAT repeat domain-containing protein [Planctomycetota bacterium]